MAVPIPDTHRDLLVEPIHGVFSTMMPDGQPQSGKQRFYGDMYPVEQQQKETRVIVKIEPIKVSLDAIFR